MTKANQNRILLNRDVPDNNKSPPKIKINIETLNIFSNPISYMATQNDDAVCDVQFSLRVPKSMADEISARSQAEGMKPASWIRKAISKAMIDMDKKILSSSKADLIKLIENDKDVQSAILKLTGLKDSDREKMKEMDARFKRLRKVTENRLDDLAKQKKSLQKDMTAAEKQISSLINDIDKLHLAGSETEDDKKRTESYSAELKHKRDEFEVIQKSILSVEAETEKTKLELAALVADAERAKVLKKWDTVSLNSSDKKLWLDDLEKLEIKEELEDE